MFHRNIQAKVSSYQPSLWEATSEVNFTCGANLNRVNECVLEVHREYFNKHVVFRRKCIGSFGKALAARFEVSEHIYGPRDFLF